MGVPQVGVVQRGFSALDAGQVQHIVDEVQQVIAGDLDIVHTVPEGVFVFPALFQHVCKADDGVHRGADVVGHVEQEGGLRPVGGLGPAAGVLQRPLHGQLVFPLLVDVREAQDDVLHFAVGKQRRDDAVDVLFPITVVDVLIRKDLPVFPQLRQQVVQGAFPQEFRLVVLFHKAFRVIRDAVVP